MRTVVPIAPRRPPARTLRRPAIALGTLLLAGLLPGAVTAAAPTAPATPRASSAAGLQPTVQYEDAMAHEHDRIAFAPGGRVTVPFQPRESDRWTVDGSAPTALPSGRTSGTFMRDAPTADAQTTRPVASTAIGDDRPYIDPSTVIAADSASWDPASDAPVFAPAARVSPNGLRREVFGFLPYWELADSSTRLDWQKISTVAYFGVGADGTGNLQKKDPDGSLSTGWSGWTSSRMTGVINAAHASGARVVLTVQSFGWTSSGLARQKSLLGSPTYRARLARQIVAAVRDRGADGVNLDFEPIASGYADEFTALVRTVRAGLNRAAKGYQLTFDTTGWIGNYPLAAATAKGGADAVFVMGYDYRGSASTPVGSIAPVGGASYDVSDTIKAYLKEIPASRIILGVPYYGRAWSTSSGALHAKNISGTKYGASASVPYANAVAFAKAYGRRYDPVEGVAWVAYRRENCTAAYGCVKPWRQLYYDDATALRAKYDLVNRLGLRGIGIWALGYDGTRTELYTAIKDKFITDKVPPKIKAGALSAPSFSPNRDGRMDSVTATLTVTGLDSWGYAVAPLSGTVAGKVIRSGTRTGTSPKLTWTGTDAKGHVVKDGRYQITLWAADASKNRVQRTFVVIVDTRPPAISSTVSPAYLSPDGNGRFDRVTLRWSASQPLSGQVRLIDARGTTVRRWTVARRTTWTTSWAGKDSGGAVVRDGRYTLRVVGLDAAGNQAVRDATFLVDRTIRSIDWSVSAFDPRAKKTARASLVTTRASRVEVAVYRGSTLVRSLATGQLKAGTHAWTWDGKTTTGAWAAPGRYQVVVRATSWVGTTRASRIVTVGVH
jgi:spore germination protein YaaH/flagellar hook assembly protein FlgD